MGKTRFAIIGAGNGGHAFAAHLTLLGHSVSLWDVDPNLVNELRAAGRVVADGAVQGSAAVDRITADIGEAVKEADVVMFVIPAIYQASVAERLAPHLDKSQVVVLNPGATGGALEVSHVLGRQGRTATVAETNTLLYACRSPRPGEVIVSGVKEELEIAALPSRDLQRVLDLLNPTLPQFKGAGNVLYTSLYNVNAMMHPLPTLLNAGRCEAAAPFQYYLEGVTPSIARLIEALDDERRAVGRAFGLDLPSIAAWYALSYEVKGDSLYERVHSNPAYRGIQGPTSLNTRYLYEDIPTGLVPLSEFGRVAGVPTPLMDAVVNLGSSLVGRDFRAEGRNLERLGLAGKDVQQIRAELA